MNSLTIDPVADVLKRLFQEAEIADSPLMERYRNGEVTQEEQNVIGFLIVHSYI